ncbi:MAG: hypothetical protein Q9227_003296 [Pyrenula ochraceoflavens]
MSPASCEGNRPCPGYNRGRKFQDEGVKLRRRQKGHRDDSTVGDCPVKFQDDCTFDVEYHDRPLAEYKVSWSREDLYEAFALIKAQRGESRFTFQNWMNGHIHKINHANWSDLDNVISISSPGLMQHQLMQAARSLDAESETEVFGPRRRGPAVVTELLFYKESDPLLDNAIRAIALTNIGRHHRVPKLIDWSRVCYGKALTILSRILNDQEKALSDETLGATILLSFYEMFTTELDRSWVRHAKGSAALLKARGPASLRNGLGRDFLLSYRHILITEAFISESACFLDEPEWQDLLWTIHEDLRSTVGSGNNALVYDCGERFLQVSARLPGVTKQASAIPALLRANNPCVDEIQEDIKNRVAEAKAELKACFAELQDRLIEANHQPIIQPCDDPLFKKAIKFPSVYVSSIHASFWALIILLNHFLKRLTKDEKAKVEYEEESRTCAISTCQSVYYIEKSSHIGPFYLIYSLRLSLYAFTHGPERDWIIHKLLRLGDTKMAMAKPPPAYLVQEDTQKAGRWPLKAVNTL